MPEWWTSKPGLDNRWEPPWLGRRIRGMKTAAVAALGAALAVPGAAFADGLPVVGLDGSQGVVSANGAYRYTTVADGPRTVVERLRVRGATIARQRDIRGTFLVPVVAYDSATSGLSADGRTLVLIRPRRQPVLAQKHTKLLVLDATRLTVRREVTLPGDSPVVGKHIFDLRLPHDCALVAVVRDGHVIIPEPETPLVAGDEILAIATTETEELFRNTITGG